MIISDLHGACKTGESYIHTAFCLQGCVSDFYNHNVCIGLWISCIDMGVLAGTISIPKRVAC